MVAVAAVQDAGAGKIRVWDLHFLGSVVVYTVLSDVGGRRPVLAVSFVLRWRQAAGGRRLAYTSFGDYLHVGLALADESHTPTGFVPFLSALYHI